MDKKELKEKINLNLGEGTLVKIGNDIHIIGGKKCAKKEQETWDNMSIDKRLDWLNKDKSLDHNDLINSIANKNWAELESYEKEY
jgi:hypothetical protein